MMQALEPNLPVFDLCSPSMTGMGLEIARTLPLLLAARRSGYRPRLWTFHPWAFNDADLEIIPLQQGWAPLLPPAAPGLGAVWLPSHHPQGPYVCPGALSAARERGFQALDAAGIDPNRAGSLTDWVAATAHRLFPSQCAVAINEPGWGLYPADALLSGTNALTVLNLIGAHGNEKGLADAAIACAVADRIAIANPQRQFVLLLHARVCAGQTATLTSPNTHLLKHLDCDPRVARLLHRTVLVITVEGGLAHAALYRGCTVILIGLAHWLDETAYLYDPRRAVKRCALAGLTEDALATGIMDVLATSASLSVMAGSKTVSRLARSPTTL